MAETRWTHKNVVFSDNISYNPRYSK